MRAGHLCLLWCFAMGLVGTVGCDPKPGANETKKPAPAPLAKREPAPKADTSPAPEIPAKEEPAPQAEPAPAIEASTPPVVEAPLPEDNVPPPAAMPSVALTDEHAATCRVKVGDTLPDFSLPDLAGHEQSVHKLFGAKLSVIVFWNGKKPTELEELADLESKVSRRFSRKGVSVVAIYTQADSQLASQMVETAHAAFPVLLDEKGTALEQVATSHLPRTYLVDPAGKILWFDLEYSTTTRRDLLAAIRYALAH
jgi:peroxiredoxin